MQITDIRIRRINGDGKMKAVASITIDRMFVVHDLRVVEGTSGLFVAMPSRKTVEGEYKDVAHPITTECRAMIQAAVLQAFEQADMKDVG